MPAGDDGEYTARLRIESQDLSPAQITQLIGLQPSTVHAKGDVRRGSPPARPYFHDSNVWIYQSPLSRNVTLDDHFHLLFHELHSRQRVLEELAIQNFVYMHCSFLIESYGDGFYLNQSTVSHLAELSLSVIVDGFTPGEFSVDPHTEDIASLIDWRQWTRGTLLASISKQHSPLDIPRSDILDALSHALAGWSRCDNAEISASVPNFVRHRHDATFVRTTGVLPNIQDAFDAMISSLAAGSDQMSKVGIHHIQIDCLLSVASASGQVGFVVENADLKSMDAVGAGLGFVTAHREVINQQFGVGN